MVGNVPKFIEIIPSTGDVVAIAQGLAHQKLEAVLASPLADSIRFILTADTLVAHGENILGKPLHIEAARRMLLGHLGSTHIVVSAAWLFDRQTQTKYPFIETAHVFFKPFHPEFETLIEQYLKLTPPHGPLDKAGAYGIQEPIVGDNFIERIEGSYEAIVGFPLKSLIDVYQKLTLGI